MPEASPYAELFQPGQMGNLRLKNRLVMAPMLTHLATETGAVTEDQIRYYEERARGGVGLIIVEATCVAAPLGKGFADETCLDREGLVSGHARLVEAVHSWGARIAIQLHHAGRRTYPRFIGGLQPVGPSPVADAGGYPVPRELTPEEIEGIIRSFGAAAERARRAGYDAVEIHGAHGYLLHQFLAAKSNQRRDKYGGDPESRLRFTLEVIESIRQQAGRDYLIIYRFSAASGYSLEDTLTFARAWESAGVNALHVSVGGIGPSPVEPPALSPMARPQGWITHYAGEVKRLVKVPVITVGEIRHPEFAQSLLRQGKADFIALGRPLLADPEWPRKAGQGHPEEIRHCISCAYCRLSLQRSTPIRCLVNPATGRERTLAAPEPAPVKKRVIIIGGGPAGMEAARIAALRGHQVSLYEKGPALGHGQLRLAAVPPWKEKLRWLLDYFDRQLAKLAVEVHLNCALEAAAVKKLAPDAVIVATGARPLIPNIPGVTGQNVVNAHQVLGGEAPSLGKRVIVLGGRQTGCETAEFLAGKGYMVTIVARSPKEELAEGAFPGQRESLLFRLARGGVETMVEHDVKEIRADGVVLVDKPGRESFRQADAVVLARGVVANRELGEALAGEVPHLQVVGDALEPRNIAQAIYEGRLAGERV